MGEERVIHHARLFPAPHHDVHGIVEHRVPQGAGGLRQKHPGFGMPPADHGEGPDVILVRVGNDHRVEVLVADCVQDGQGIEPFLPWVKSAVEQNPFSAGLEEVGVGSNLSPACEVGKYKRTHPAHPPRPDGAWQRESRGIPAGADRTGLTSHPLPLSSAR